LSVCGMRALLYSCPVPLGAAGAACVGLRSPLLAGVVPERARLLCAGFAAFCSRWWPERLGGAPTPSRILASVRTPAWLVLRPRGALVVRARFAPLCLLPRLGCPSTMRARGCHYSRSRCVHPYPRLFRRGLVVRAGCTALCSHRKALERSAARAPADGMVLPLEQQPKSSCPSGSCSDHAGRWWFHVRAGFVAFCSRWKVLELDDQSSTTRARGCSRLLADRSEI
jgi:hypothetical protein